MLSTILSWLAEKAAIPAVIVLVGLLIWREISWSSKYSSLSDSLVKTQTLLSDRETEIKTLDGNIASLKDAITQQNTQIQGLKSAQEVTAANAATAVVRSESTPVRTTFPVNVQELNKCFVTPEKCAP